jgi:hypothetical protein
MLSRTKPTMDNERLAYRTQPEEKMMKALHKLLLAGVTCASFWVSGTAAFAQTELAVITQAGKVWARDLTTTTVGPGRQLAGPGLFGGPDDQFVFGSSNAINVVNTSGELWQHPTNYNFVGPGDHLPGTLFGGPDAKYVLASDFIYVINTQGEVWAHWWGTSVSDGWKLNGPNLFGSPDDKYALLDYQGGQFPFQRILIVNKQGKVWAHDLSCSVPPIPPSFGCTIDTVGGGYQLNGPTLFGAPNDKYVVLHNDLLLVINTYGQVWARNITHSAVGAGYKLSGPALFGSSDDKYVVVYDVTTIQ